MKKVTLTAASIALALGLAGCNDSKPTDAPKVEEVAQKQLVSGIDLENRDLTVRAQDDFYYHVNGKWLEKTEIPADKSNYGSFTALYDNSQKALRDVIEAAAKSDAKPGTDERKLGDFYKSMMDVDGIEARGLTPLKSQLDAINAVENHQALTTVMAKLRTQGGTTPFAWYVNNDAKNSSMNALYMYQSGIGLPDRDYYLKDTEKFTKIRAEYENYITTILTAAGIEGAADKAKGIIALETQLADAMWSRVESRDANKRYNKMTLAEADALMGELALADFLAAAGLNTDEVIVSQPSYMEKFGALYTQTDVSVWQDYLTFHMISAYAEILPKAFADANFAFYKTTLRGIEAQKPRWKMAVDSANSVLGEILGKVYVKEYFPPEAKARMGELVDNLIKGYANSIDELEWMSEETKVAAKEKLAKFTPKIGYPDKWKDYSNLTITDKDVVANFINYSEFEYQDMASKLGQPVDRSEWFMTPQTVNAYFNPVNNEIVFPAAILQPPFFNLEADDAVNYGAIGAVIGHELGHGFDDQGAKYDGDGNLRNWWSDSDLEQFQTRGAQLVEQYNAYKPFEDANVNGELTLGENIGDLGGLTVAYKAYMLSLDGKEAPMLDGYSGPQRFFMGWSQIWRRKYRDEELRNRLMTDSHSPSHYRVIGIVANMPEFYQAFDVKEGDKMYIAPENRVKIW